MSVYTTATIFLRPCGLAPSRQYSFGLAASPPHGNIPALRPRPLTAIFFWPCGLAPSRRNRFSICLTVNVDLFFSRPLTAKSIFYLPHGECQFIFLTPPHGEIDFLFASQQMSINFSHPPLTAKSIFYSPHGECRFSIRLTANINFIFLMPPHGKIDSLFASRQM